MVSAFFVVPFPNPNLNPTESPTNKGDCPLQLISLENPVLVAVMERFGGNHNRCIARGRRSCRRRY
jgi:hypothetical protein